MRARLHKRLPSLLALTFVALLALPISTVASSGLPATVTMNPGSAAPGATVEVRGLEFPALAVVELHIATSAGLVHLVDTVTADNGYFREVVTLPPDAPAGAWELRANASDGSTASYRFDSAAGAATSSGAGASDAASAAGPGSPGADLVFLLVIAALLAAVGGSLAYVWREVRGGDRQPGMGAGDDPIWSGTTSPEAPLELTAVEDPAWTAAHGES